MIVKNAKVYRRRRLAIPCIITTALLWVLVLHVADIAPGTIWPVMVVAAMIIFAVAALVLLAPDWPSDRYQDGGDQDHDPGSH